MNKRPALDVPAEPWLSVDFTFQLVPTWPPRFRAQLPALIRASVEEAQRSAAATAKRRALLDSDDEADRRRGSRSMFGMSRAADERISKGRT